jgi:hypothetical protein
LQMHVILRYKVWNWQKNKKNMYIIIL